MATYTTSFGSPVNYPHAAQRVSTNGPLLLQDFHAIDNLAHLARERIPERLVHAKGAGAYGYFEATEDLSDITSQTLFRPGNKVDATVRFSTVAGESGSADTARDVHGFAIKLKTDQGILDWVCLNTPTFFIRDPAKYPDLVHATKRNPRTNLKDHDMYWDFFSSNPETVHQIMMILSDRGTPDGFHQQHGFGGTAFKWCKEDGTFHYVKVHVKLNGQVKCLCGNRLAGEDPDYGTRILHEAIEASNFPEWTVKIQTMTQEQAEGEYNHIAFDVTKVWPHAEFPLRPIGKLVLNKNPENCFDEIEQLGFAPAHMIPYIEPSPDPLLQCRLFIYPDTPRYRLWANNQQLPCNAPIRNVAKFQRAGTASFISQGRRPNYQSSTQSLSFDSPPNAIDSQVNNNHRHERFDGTILTSIDDFVQPRALWKYWDKVEQAAFISNVSSGLGLVGSLQILYNQLLVFYQVDPEIAHLIEKTIQRKDLPPLPDANTA
ncbi:catalase [Mycena olivaceomarginata]|nr:catalase [Mycena olivaceomarginata]